MDDIEKSGICFSWLKGFSDDIEKSIYFYMDEPILNKALKDFHLNYQIALDRFKSKLIEEFGETL